MISVRQERQKDHEPQRNHLCRYYEDCLETAAMKNLPELPCRGCEHEQDQGGKQKFRDYIEGSWALLYALFHRHRKETERESIHTLLATYYPPSVDYVSENNKFADQSCDSSEE
jgi:hypothetical protein